MREHQVTFKLCTLTLVVPYTISLDRHFQLLLLYPIISGIQESSLFHDSLSLDSQISNSIHPYKLNRPRPTTELTDDVDVDVLGGVSGGAQLEGGQLARVEVPHRLALELALLRRPPVAAGSFRYHSMWY